MDVLLEIIKHNSHALTEIANEHIKTKQLQLSNNTKLGPSIHEHFCFYHFKGILLVQTFQINNTIHMSNLLADAIKFQHTPQTFFFFILINDILHKHYIKLTYRYR